MAQMQPKIVVLWLLNNQSFSFWWQKQPLEVFYKKCSYKFHNIHIKTPVLESLFNKVAGLDATGIFQDFFVYFKGVQFLMKTFGC